MKLGMPWSVEGIRPEARETALEAARRSGMSLGAWLNTVILEQRAEASIRAPGHEHDDEADYADELASVQERLDSLTHRIAQFSRGGERHGKRRGRDERAEPKPDQIAQLIDRLDRRLEQLLLQSARPAPMPPMLAAISYAPAYAAPVAPLTHRPMPAVLDRAIAEITARPRALRGEPASPTTPTVPPLIPQAAPEPMLRPVLQQNLTGLEDQLRRITDQIETLRRPGVEEAINALRDELGDIGRALNDAMPRRAIDIIERQIQDLTQRIAEGRQPGADQHAISGIEQGLAEVRDALRGLTPAESLVGFNDSVSALARKIDLIVAQKDPATLQQLEHAITTLRDMATHVASNDAVGTLAGEVQKLAEKVDRLGRAQGSGALKSLEERIDALSRALAERAQSGSAVSPQLEALVQSLADKIERIQESRNDPAVNHLEDRIVQLVERLDASDSRLGHLEAIERGLSDLLMQVEDMRSNRQADSIRAEAQSAVGVDTLKHDFAHTRTTLRAVNGTLGSLVERLAKMEREFRESRAADPDGPIDLTEPVGKLAMHAVVEPPAHLPPALQMPEPQQQKPAPQPLAAAPSPKPKRTAPIAPIAPNLPPDQPLEPGSGPPRRGARISTDTPQAPKKSSFIAAARRAAQSAVQEAGARVPKDAATCDAPETAATKTAERKGQVKRVKSLLVAASVAAIVIGSAQISWQFVSGLGGDEKKAAQSARPEEQSSVERPSPDRIVAIPLSPVPMLPAPKTTATTPLQIAPAAPAQLGGSVTADPNVTGTIPDGPYTARMPDPAERLPAEIGSVRLRTAAANGDAAAAYEIAIRYSEGRGVIADLAEAARWYEQAAGKGLALAQFRYATMLEKGVGVKKDLGEARRYYLAAAEKGNAKAMHNLAVLYAEGIVGKPDYTNAVEWFRRAAMHGVADSQYNLAVLAARGLGMAKNLPESCKWFALAAAQGDKEAERKRDEVAGKLDAETLAAVQRDAKAFVPQSQPAEATVVAKPPGGWDDAAPAQGPGRAGSVATMKLGKR